MAYGRKKPGTGVPGLDSFAGETGEGLPYCTVTESVVVTGVAPEAVPVIVRLNVAAEAFRLALTFKTEFAVGVTEAGLNDTLTFGS